MSKHNPAVSRLAAQLHESSVGMTPERREMLTKHVKSIFPPDVEQLIQELTPLPEGRIYRELVLDLREAVRAGFMLAVGRYSRELRSNKEAMAMIRARARGGIVGRAKSSQRSVHLAQRIREKWAAMEAAGEKVTNDSVAAAIGCSRSTVIRAFKSTRPKRPKR